MQIKKRTSTARKRALFDASIHGRFNAAHLDSHLLGVLDGHLRPPLAVHLRPPLAVHHMQPIANLHFPPDSGSSETCRMLCIHARLLLRCQLD